MGALVVLALALAGTQPDGGSHRALATGARATPLPESLAPLASSSFGASDERYWPLRVGGRLLTRAGGIGAAFSPAGARFRVREGTLALSLSGAGAAGDLRSLGRRTVPSERGNRILYRYGAISEFYANGPFGVVQGFTIRRPIAPAPALELDIALAGSLSARQTGSEIEFVDGAGETALRYGQLSATDATGRALPARMRLAAGKLELRIDARGARYPVTVDPFLQVGEKLTGKAESATGQFGYSVALSADGDTALIGAPKDGEVGSAFVFARSGSSWSQQGEKLTPSGPKSRLGFGASVAISGDGNTALIGAPAANTNVGAAYVFTRSGTTWTQAQVLTGAGEIGSGAFGESVSLSSDASTALVGAPRQRGSATESTGAAYLYKRSGSAWTQQAVLELTGAEATEEAEAGGTSFFGQSVSLSSEGDTALIGAPGYAYDKGAAWIFTAQGSTWSAQAVKLTGAGESGEAVFGASTALSGDGSTALIGGEQDRGGIGAAWVFTHSGSTWTQQGEKLTGVGESGVAGFGGSVTLSSDGDTALIGGRLDSASRGAAWVFTRTGSTWSQEGEKLTGAGEVGEGVFGSSVALSGAGSSALIGARNDNPYAGAAWVFEAGSSEIMGGGSNTPSQPGKTETNTGSHPNTKVVIERVEVTSTGLLVTVKALSAGTVTLSGDGLEKLVRAVSAGTHRLSILLTKAGQTLRRHADTIKLSAALATQAGASAHASRDVKL